MYSLQTLALISLLGAYLREDSRLVKYIAIISINTNTIDQLMLGLESDSQRL